MTPDVVPLRLVTWNAARGTFATKAAQLEPLQADIAIIQEIARPQLARGDVVWFGDKPHQGVAVVARPPWQVVPMAQIPDAPRYFAPFRITGPLTFTLFAVWSLAQRPFQYIRGAVRCVELYASVFEQPGDVVVIGDFNANAIWNHLHPPTKNYAALVERLDDHGLTSAYHHFRNEAHGAEKEATFFLYRHATRRFHIDYGFLPTSWLPHLRHVEIGRHADWLKASDHCPLVIDLQLPVVNS